MSIKLKIYNQKAESAGEVKLSDKIFGVETNEALVHQAMVAQMANERQVIAHTKDRSEVRGGGRKPWRQKGTGRARAGSNRSPIWIGGGVTFGPRNERNFKKKLNKKMRQKAIFMVLSDRAKSGNLIILDKFKVSEYKTKAMDGILLGFKRAQATAADQSVNKETKNTTENKQTNKEDLKNKKSEKGKKEVKQKKSKAEKRSVLMVNDNKDDKVKYSTRNLVGAKMININNINILDLLKYKNLIITKESINKLEEQYK